MSSETIELYKRFPSKMPSEIEEIYKHLHGDVIELIWRWKMYSQLYIKKETVALLNESAPNTFGLIQNSLIDNILLIVCKLTDRHETSGHMTLSFGQLKKCIAEGNHRDLEGKINEQLKDIEPMLKEARMVRNNRIAHNDLKAIRGKNAFPIEKQKLEGILARLGKILNLVEEHFGDPIVQYENMFLTDDGNTLLSCLDVARKHRNRRFRTPCCC